MTPYFRALLTFMCLVPLVTVLFDNFVTGVVVALLAALCMWLLTRRFGPDRQETHDTA